MDTSTIPEPDDVTHVARAHRLRQAFFVALTLFLLAAALGAFGVRSRTVSASGGGYTLSVTYGNVSRPGLATPWSVEIIKPGGFDGPVTVALASKFFDAFDENGFEPDAVSSTSDGEWTVLEFDPPEGDTLALSFDAGVEPAVQFKRVRGGSRILEDGKPVVEVTYSMWVVP